MSATYSAGDRVQATGDGSNYHGCTGTVIRDAGEAGVEVRWDDVPHPALPLVTLHSHAYIELEPHGPVSGDLCRFVTHPNGATYPAVEHYRCDDFRDGTITDPATGRILKRGDYANAMGFDR